MAKEEKVEFEGEVVEALPNAMFRVQLDNGHEVLGHVAGKMRRFRIRILPGDRVRVEVDTRGTRLHDIQILKADGTAIRPQTIEFPGYYSNSGSGVSFGIGAGRSSYGGGGTSVGTGVGFGTTFPVGDPVAEGNTVAYFALDQIGPAPWRVRVELGGLGPAFFTLGIDPSATK